MSHEREHSFTSRISLPSIYISIRFLTQTARVFAWLERPHSEIWSSDVTAAGAAFYSLISLEQRRGCKTDGEGRGRSGAGRIEDRRWTVTGGNTSSPSPRSLIDGRTRERHGGRVHANTCYEQQVRASVSSLLPLLLFPLAASFPLSFSSRSRRSIRLAGLAGSSFVPFCARFRGSNRSSRTSGSQSEREIERGHSR